MRNLHSITTSQAAIAVLFRVINRYVGNLPPMLWACGHRRARAGPPVAKIRNTSPYWRGGSSPERRCLVLADSFAVHAQSATRRPKISMAFGSAGRCSHFGRGNALGTSRLMS